MSNTKKNSSKKKIIHRRYALIIILVIGISLVAFALFLENPRDTNTIQSWFSWIVGGLGTTVLSIGGIGLIYEIVLRRKFLEEMKQEVKCAVKDAIPIFKENTTEALDQAVKSYMPEKYPNIKDSGIVDVYPEFYINKLKEKFENVQDADIKILKIWFDAFDKLVDPLVDAINNRRCSLEIILSDPEDPVAIEAIEKRVDMLNEYDTKSVQDKIHRNIKGVKNIYERLTPDKKNNISLKLHTSFISTSLIKYGPDILIGFYLHGKLATNGTIIKVCKSASGTNKFYKNLREHYNIQSKNSRKVDLGAKKKEGDKNIIPIKENIKKAR